MHASFCSIGLNLVLNATLMRVLGFMAFPLSTTLAAILNVGVLIALLPRKVGRVEFGPLARYAGGLAVASAAGGGAAWLGNRAIARAIGRPSRRQRRASSPADSSGSLSSTPGRASSASPKPATTSAASSEDKEGPRSSQNLNLRRPGPFFVLTVPVGRNIIRSPHGRSGRRRVSPDERLSRRTSARRDF